MWIPLFTAAVAISYGYYRSHRPAGGFELNHVTMFTLGFLFYWLFPSLFGVIPVPDAAALPSALIDYISSVPDPRMLGYSISILFCYFAFAGGDALGAYPIIKRRQAPPKPIFEAKLWKAEWIVVFLIFLAMTIKIRGALFSGYADAGADFLARGTLVAVSLMLLSISWKLALEDRWRFMQAYFVCALVLLASGGRLYFVSSVITLLVYFSHRKPIRAKVLLFWGSVAMLLMGIVGVIRVDSQASLLLIFMNVATESLFTSFSLFSYLQFNPIAWIKLPTFLLGDLANLVPSAFMDKSHLIALTDSRYEISSPMGALNSWVSFNVNFGVIGTLLFLFLFGYLMRKNSKMTVTYLMMTGFVAFTFFRDPFSISIVKNMLEFSILIPFFLERFNNLIAFSVRA